MAEGQSVLCHDVAARPIYPGGMYDEDDDRDRLIATYEQRLDACSAKVTERVHSLEGTTEPDAKRAAVEDISLLTHAIANLRLELAQIRELIAVRLDAEPPA